MTQTEMFEQTELEKLEPVRLHLVSEMDKAATAVSNAKQKFAEARERVDAIEAHMERLQDETPTVDPVTGEVGDPTFTTFAEASQPPEADDDIWTDDDEAQGGQAP